MRGGQGQPPSRLRFTVYVREIGRALLGLEMALDRLDDEACLAPTRALYLALNLTEQGPRAVERNAEVARVPFSRTFRRRRFPRRGPFTVCVRRVRRGGCGCGFGGYRRLGGRRRRLALGGRGACGRDEIIERRGCALSLRHGGPQPFRFEMCAARSRNSCAAREVGAYCSIAWE
jgi:hypothetical protein